MCGIVGIVAKNSRKYEKEINKMVESLHHRGPDGNGTHYSDNCALGHTRLSIIDIEGGQQPMKSPVSGSAITFNGEIYGYQDIKKELSDYPFKTKSDTEVILALYDKYGAEMMSKLPGMFSFGIWDNSKERLFCARDRFGEKPFYYALGSNGEFIFASEIKAILATGLVEPILDLNAIAHYLKFSHLHPNTTCYQNILTLPPAHQLIFKDGNINVKPYWKLPETNNQLTYSEALEKFEYLFKKSVKKQLIADVPVGAFLSGGLDSSSVVVEASEFAPKIKTFSFGFENTISELPYAREVAKMYNTEHIELTDSRNDLTDLFLKIPQIYDEPFGDSSAIPTYLISKLAREHSKVILTGDGADELLGGYVWSYRRLYDYSKKIPKSELEFIMTKFHYKFKKKILKIHDISLGDTVAAYKSLKKNKDTISLNHYRNREQIKNEKLIQMGMKINPDMVDKDFINFNTKTVDDALRHDIKAYMSGAILTKTDRASMANGLELRAPFLDVDLAEFCISLPSDFKIDAVRDKLPLRETYESKWPDMLRNRPKQGFGIPMKEWLQRDDFKNLKSEYLKDKNKKIFEIFDYNSIREFYDTDTQITWSFLMLSVWMEQNNYKMGVIE